MPKPGLLILPVVLCIFSNTYAQNPIELKKIMNAFPAIHSHSSKTFITNVSPAFLQTGMSPYAYHLRKPTPDNKFKTFTPTPNQCYDTSVRLIYKNDTVWTYNDFVTQTKDGNILIPGFDYNDKTNEYAAHIIKCTRQGDTLWYKKLNSGYSKHFIELYHAFELKDNSLILVGGQDVPVPYNGKEILLIVKLSAKGDLIWEHTYESKYWDIDPSSGGEYIADCKEDANGDLYFCGSITYWDSQPRAAIVLKTDNAGIPVWSKGFTVGSRPVLAGMQIKNDSLQLLGNTYMDYAGMNIWGVSLNKNTGDTNYVKAWQMPYNSTASYNAYTYTSALVPANNGNYYVFGNTLGDVYNFDTSHPWVHHSVLEFTPELDFVRSTLFQSWQQSNGDDSRITIFPDGSGALSRLQYFSGYTTNVLFATFNQDQIIKERVIPYHGRSNLWISNFIDLGNGGQFVTQSVGDSVNNYVGIEIDKLHNSDTSAYCLGTDTSITQIVPGIPYSQSNYFGFDSIKTKIFTITDRPFGAESNTGIDIVSGCEAVSFCNSLKLKTSADTLCPSTPVFITVEKNKECGSLPYWNYDSSVVKSFAGINDSTMKLIFKSSWQGKLSASVDGCSGLVSDSINLVVLQAPVKLDLGPDSVVCPGNTITLNAGAGYAGYTWQDGSTDSIYTVTKPGVYFVHTTTACGTAFNDTVTVSPHAPIPLNIGADTTICNGDSVTIKAPQGFMHYSWSPDNFISDTSTPTVTVYPAVVTQYKLAAEKTPGCFAYDSINIVVNENPTVYIGNDTSICNGDTVVLSTGNNFASYAWNTGSTNAMIEVTKAGMYSVTITAANSCTATDTMRVTAVYDLPAIHLAKDSAICNGSSLLLDAGAGFASYLWQNGSTAQTYTASSVGTYYVQVTDQRDCMGSDTSIIKTINPLPSAFLISDTAKCSYDSLVLQSKQDYNAYQWSTGSTEKYITIGSPGSYWLLVTDNNNCMQKEYTTVTEKECYNTIYYPTAFSPNHDGLNDYFRPKLFGTLQAYHMTIYNRWGAKIFETTNWQNGWDGTTNGILQNNDSYVWLVTYQLKGLDPVTQKGMVTIVK